MPKAGEDDKEKKWSKEDDTKLLSLFDKYFRDPRANTTGADPRDLGQKNIQRVLDDHWPGRKYRNFSQVFRNKARQYLVNKSKEGARRSKCMFAFAAELFLTNRYLSIRRSS